MKGSIRQRGNGYELQFYHSKRNHAWRFKSYEDAENFQIILNYKEREGSLDMRDYAKDQPLSFSNLAAQWLQIREDEGLKSLRHLKNHMAHAVKYFGHQNIKAIGTAGVEDFFSHLRRTTDLSGKTLHNIRTTLHAFFAWAVKREDGALKMPNFPVIKFELGWRKIVDKETQFRILDEVKRISWGVNPRIYIGILWLATYPNVRPIELLHIKEEDIDLANKLIVVKHNKVPSQYKRIYLLEEDCELIRGLPRGMPTLYFFRHDRIRKGVHRSRSGQFGNNYLYKFWKSACENLGVGGVDLYGGTRHSTVTALGDHFSPEEIMGDGSGHTTNKAFARYFQLRGEQRRAISAVARGGGAKVRKIKEG